MQRSKGEFCQPLWLWFPLTATYVKNKDKIVPTDRTLQPAVEECEGGQEEGEIETEEPCDCPEIVEQSALDHFSSILQKAQKLAAEAERKKHPKHPKQYDGKSTRTLKRQKKCWEDLAKQGYLLVFEFMAHVEEKVKKSAHMKQLVTRAVESEQVLDKSASEELDTKDLVSKHVGQVCCQELLIHWYWQTRPACSHRRGGGGFWQDPRHDKQFEWGRWWAPQSGGRSSTGCQWNSKSNPGAPWEPLPWTCPSGRSPTSPSWQSIGFAAWSCSIVEDLREIVAAEPRQKTWCCFPGLHHCHDWGLEPLSGPRAFIHLEGSINCCHKSTGAWINLCMQHLNMGPRLCSRREASPSLLWLYLADCSWGWRDLEGNTGRVVKEIEGWLYQGPGCLWHCCERETSGLVLAAGNSQAQHFIDNGAAVAHETEMAIHQSKKQDVTAVTLDLKS